jgi:hypothetical protein
MAYKEDGSGWQTFHGVCTWRVASYVLNRNGLLEGSRTHMTTGCFTFRLCFLDYRNCDTLVTCFDSPEYWSQGLMKFHLTCLIHKIWRNNLTHFACNTFFDWSIDVSSILSFALRTGDDFWYSLCNNYIKLTLHREVMPFCLRFWSPKLVNGFGFNFEDMLLNGRIILK